MENEYISINEIEKILGISKRSIKKLLDEGYLKTLSVQKGRSWIKVIQVEELENLKSNIKEIKDFWVKKTKINRQIGIKKASDIKNKKNDLTNNFKLSFFEKVENFSHDLSILIKVAYSILTLNFYIERKLQKHIKDFELINLFNKSIKKLIEVYSNTEYLKIYVIETGKVFVEYCKTCLKQSNVSILTQETCPKCFINNDYYSILSIYISVFDYNFVINTDYAEIKKLFKTDFKHGKIKSTFVDKTHASKSNYQFTDGDFKSYKINEVIDYLSDFSKTSSFSFFKQIDKNT